jgi:hypothetical protein
VFLVTHIAFYGVGFLLTLYFWRSACREMEQFGPGIVGCVLLALLLSLNSQSRFFINIFPLVLPFVVKAAESHLRRKQPLILLAGAAVLLSKVWFTINTAPFTGRLHEFPDQGLFMTHGPWISPSMYLAQGVGFLALAGLLYLSWFPRGGIESSARYGLVDSHAIDTESPRQVSLPPEQAA